MKTPFPSAREAGFAVLALMTVMLTASSVYLAGHFTDRAGERRHQSAATKAALDQARQALLGYAAAYPDRVNPRFGPGYLPCPARNRRGIAGSACSVTTGSTLGRFPWHTLRTNDIRDSSGQALWYAVSQAHRYNPKLEPLNSDVAGLVMVDGEQTVAVLIAPGPPLAQQHYRGSRPAAAEQFLEHQNADGNAASFTRNPLTTPAHNDQTALLTRRDLMAAVETRVLGELAQRLNMFASLNGGRYPWLSPQRAAASASRLSEVGQREGWLPFHYFDPQRSIDAQDSFAADIALSWELNDATVSLDDADGLIPQGCLSRLPCTALAGMELAVALAGQATCLWWSPDELVPPREVARCELERAQRDGDWAFDYRVSFAIRNDAPNLSVSPPTLARARTRSVVVNQPGQLGALPGLFIEISLTVSHLDGRSAHMSLSSNAATQGFFAVHGIPYAPDVNHGELPAWLIRNGWHERVFLAFAESDCLARLECLRVEISRAGRSPTMHGNVRAVAIAAGPALPGFMQRAADSDIAAWLEQGNRRAGDRNEPFSVAPASSLFNDRLRIIERLP
jgi:hypothetical protein